MPKKYTKYTKFSKLNLNNRQWPDQEIFKAPLWCSVDLRDGNQSLINPMDIKDKLKMFKLLVDIGFKEIEIGFPSAAKIEYDFLRQLIEENLIPEDVTVQVLTQAREHLIKKTAQALVGVKKAIIHVYNSTSVLQRQVVFAKNKEQIKQMAVDGAKLVRQYANKYLADSQICFEYSPESFTGTEIDYAIDVCQSVYEVWQGFSQKKNIYNLPATVEMSTPNIFADQIEYFCHNFKYRQDSIISLHCHNDRGESVAATELGLLAGADRVEGSLFGNGERSGNVDLVTLALNLYTQGIDPKLDFSNIDQVIEVYKQCTDMDVYCRAPYAGELVHTAFSGSHQDAINKGMQALSKNEQKIWQVPYLPIDPADIGREYQALVRINSQSGKGGVAYIMEREFGFRMPKAMHPEFAKIVQKISEKTGDEVLPEQIYQAFKDEYLFTDGLVQFVSCQINVDSNEEKLDNSITTIKAKLKIQDEVIELEQSGNGPVDALVKAIRDYTKTDFQLTSYDQHALESGSDSRAATYIQLQNNLNQKTYFGVGIDHNTNTTSFKAVVSAFNRMQKDNNICEKQK